MRVKIKISFSRWCRFELATSAIRTGLPKVVLLALESRPQRHFFGRPVSNVNYLR